MSQKILAALWVGICLHVMTSIGRAETYSPDQIKKAVEEAISQRHPKDTPEWWQGLGPQAPAVILEMAKETTHTYRRLRLLQALAFYDDSAARDYLKQTAESTDNSVFRGAAVKSYGLVTGLSPAGADVEFLEKFAKHPDPQTRMAAALALKRAAAGRARSAEASKALERFQASESQAWIRKRVDEATVTDDASRPGQPLTIQKPIAGALVRIGAVDPQAAPVKFELTGPVKRTGDRISGRLRMDGAKADESFTGSVEKIGRREIFKARLGGPEYREVIWVGTSKSP